LSGRGLCDELITRPEESYRLCCVVVCDLETSRIGAPYIYYISSLRVNNFTTNEDIATKSEADLPHCVRNVTTTNVLLFKFRCNIFIGVRIIKEMPGSVASGTPYTLVTAGVYLLILFSPN
jgi:hypothetical protein